MLSDSGALDVYSRQIQLPEIGEAGQQKLSDSSVLVVGCGGLGAPVLSYLTAMGIGHLGLCDGDTVASSNLNRQFLYSRKDVGKLKTDVAKKHLAALNPDMRITTYDSFFDEELAERCIHEYNVIIDCVDNFKTRFIINDACIKANKPLVHAGVGEYYGQLMTIDPGVGPCLRCLFPSGVADKEDKTQQGIIGPIPGVLGAMQALEAAKLLLGMSVCNDGLVMYDGIKMSTIKVVVKPLENCICRKEVL